MHLRRAILLFALVLGLTALAAAVSPSRKTGSAAPTPSPGTRPVSVLPRTVGFQVRESGVPQLRRARPGEHLLVTVSSGAGGLVTIPRLGRTESVSPAAPARFDLLGPAAGRYDVLVEGSSGPSEPRRIGTLVTRP